MSLSIFCSNNKEILKIKTNVLSIAHIFSHIFVLCYFKSLKLTQKKTVILRLQQIEEKSIQNLGNGGNKYVFRVLIRE